MSNFLMDLKRNNMDFDQCIKILYRLLKKHRPEKFDSGWIMKNDLRIYNFIRENVRNEVGDIDWDSITAALPRKFQKLWSFHTKGKREFGEKYFNLAEVQIILKKYKPKLYTFWALADENDRYIREAIIVALTRLAQKGNLQARRKLIKFLRYTVDEWVENSPRLRSWRGYGDYINEKIENCIRCYRFTGSFTGYLFRTLEYSGRGLRPFYRYTLDAFHPIIENRRLVESVIQDSETNEIRMYR